MRGRLQGRRRYSYTMITFVLIALFLFLMIQGLVYFEKKIRPSILSMAVIEADIIATDAINKAIMEKVARDIVYKDLVIVEKDEAGRILMAQLNTMEVNRLLAETTLATYDAMNFLEKESLSLPLGEVMGSYLLATYGPRIPVKFIPMGRVNTNLIDIFEEAGINQTRHKVYLEVHTQVRIIIPFISTPVDVYTTVPVADTIYIGEVPDTVLNLRF